MHKLFWASLYTSDILSQPFNLQKSIWHSLTLIEWYHFTLAVIKLFCLIYSRVKFWWIWLSDSVGESTKQCGNNFLVRQYFSRQPAEFCRTETAAIKLKCRLFATLFLLNQSKIQGKIKIFGWKQCH